MFNVKALIAGLVFGVVAATSAQAAPAVGTISFVGTEFTYDAGTKTITFDTSAFTVSGASGDFVGLIGDAGTIENPLDLDGILPISPIWEVSGFEFEATAINNITYIVLGSGTELLSFEAVGLLTSAAFDTSTGLWSYTGQRVGGGSSWSGTGVFRAPEPGILALVGVGLLGLGLARRRA